MNLKQDVLDIDKWPSLTEHGLRRFVNIRKYAILHIFILFQIKYVKIR